METTSPCCLFGILVEADRFPGHLRARTSWLMRHNPNFAALGRHPELTFLVAFCASNCLGGVLLDASSISYTRRSDPIVKMSAAPLSITPLVSLSRWTSYCRGGELAFRWGLPPEGRDVPDHVPGGVAKETVVSAVPSNLHKPAHA